MMGKEAGERSKERLWRKVNATLLNVNFMLSNEDRHGFLSWRAIWSDFEVKDIFLTLRNLWPQKSTSFSKEMNCI
jgi:hypothetical protein